MLWSASSLKANCAYVNILSKKRKPSASSRAAMDLGTAFHAAVETWIKTGVIPPVENDEVRGWVDELAAKWRPSADCQSEVAWGLTPEMRYCEVTEPEPHKYQRVGGGELLTAGRADLVWPGSNAVMVADWKTGRWPVTPPDQNLQVLAACIAIADKMGVAKYKPAIYYTRNAEWDIGNQHAIPGNSNDWNVSCVRFAALLDGSPVVGDHCENCWEKRNCKAYKESLPEKQ